MCVSRVGGQHAQSCGEGSSVGKCAADLLMRAEAIVERRRGAVELPKALLPCGRRMLLRSLSAARCGCGSGGSGGGGSSSSSSSSDLCRRRVAPSSRGGGGGSWRGRGAAARGGRRCCSGRRLGFDCVRCRCQRAATRRTHGGAACRAGVGPAVCCAQLQHRLLIDLLRGAQVTRTCALHRREARLGFAHCARAIGGEGLVRGCKPVSEVGESSRACRKFMSELEVSAAERLGLRLEGDESHPARATLHQSSHAATLLQQSIAIGSLDSLPLFHERQHLAARCEAGSRPTEEGFMVANEVICRPRDHESTKGARSHRVLALLRFSARRGWRWVPCAGGHT